MSSFPYADGVGPFVTRIIDTGLGPKPLGYGSWGRMRLSTESIGNFTLTLTNLIVGSAVRVETQSGTTIEYRVAASSIEVFTVPVYASGSPANNLRIKVRKASAAPYYQPYETQTTAFVGGASIYVSQLSD